MDKEGPLPKMMPVFQRTYLKKESMLTISTARVSKFEFPKSRD